MIQINITVYKPDGYDNPSAGIIDCEGHCNNDFSDIRFLTYDNNSVLDYWLESKVDGNQAIFWIKLPGNIESSGEIIMYYGNPSAVSFDNGSNTFDFFDDFESGSIDWTNKWSSTDHGNYGVSTRDGNQCLYFPQQASPSTEFIRSLRGDPYNNTPPRITSRLQISTLIQIAFFVLIMAVCVLVLGMESWDNGIVE